MNSEAFSSPSQPSESRSERIFDKEATLNRLAGDQELFLDMIDFFAEDGPALIAEIRAGFESGDIEVVGRGAHSLKGLSANFGAQHAVEAARAVEQSAKAGDMSQAMERSHDLEREVGRLTAALEMHSRRARKS
jgi:HPt (histidine-containing phosphotransfer) domain-containing protein